MPRKSYRRKLDYGKFLDEIRENLTKTSTVPKDGKGLLSPTLRRRK